MSLSARLFECIKRDSKYVEFTKDSVLFYEGDICKEVFDLYEGRVSVSVSVEREENALKELVLYDFCKEHCIVNIASALTQQAAVATARAASDIKGYLIPVSLAKRLMMQDEEYQSLIFSLFATRYTTLTRLIEDVKYKQLPFRILDFLESFNNKEILITNEEIAKQLNTSRKVVNRILQSLKTQNILSLKRGKIVLLKKNSSKQNA